MPPHRRYSDSSQFSNTSDYKKNRSNTEELSRWFSGLGLYRKYIARNESCIFRCVADSRYLSQSYFSFVQRDLFHYTQLIPEEYFSQFSQQTQLGKDAYLEHLGNPLYYKPSLSDLVLLSNMYGYNFKLYTRPDVPPIELFHSATSETILIYTDFQRTYDLLYTEERYKRLAFCQHYVYEIYYKLVFKLQDIDYAVQKMLGYSASPTRLVPGYAGMDAEGFIPNLDMDQKLMPLNVVYGKRFEMRAKCTNMRLLLDAGITPFPFKVAKALHPDIYRNIEFDGWLERKRGPRTGLEIWSNSRLVSGVSCIVRLDDERITCVIQEVYRESNEAKIYVVREKQGRMMTVPLTWLEPQTSNQVVVAQRRYLRGSWAEATDQILARKRTMDSEVGLRIQVLSEVQCQDISSSGDFDRTECDNQMPEQLMNGLKEIDNGEDKELEDIDNGKERELKEIDNRNERVLKEIDNGKERVLKEIDNGKERGLKEIDNGKERRLKEIDNGKERVLKEIENGKERVLKEIDNEKERGLKEIDNEKERRLKEIDNGKERGLKEIDNVKERRLKEIDNGKERLLKEIDNGKERVQKEIDNGKEKDSERECDSTQSEKNESDPSEEREQSNETVVCEEVCTRRVARELVNESRGNETVVTNKEEVESREKRDTNVGSNEKDNEEKERIDRECDSTQDSNEDEMASLGKKLNHKQVAEPLDVERVSPVSTGCITPVTEITSTQVSLAYRGSHVRHNPRRISRDKVERLEFSDRMDSKVKILESSDRMDSKVKRLESSDRMDSKVKRLESSECVTVDSAVILYRKNSDLQSQETRRERQGDRSCKENRPVDKAPRQRQWSLGGHIGHRTPTIRKKSPSSTSMGSVAPTIPSPYQLTPTYSLQCPHEWQEGPVYYDVNFNEAASNLNPAGTGYFYSDPPPPFCKYETSPPNVASGYEVPPLCYGYSEGYTPPMYEVYNASPEMYNTSPEMYNTSEIPPEMYAQETAHFLLPSCSPFLPEYYSYSPTPLVYTDPPSNVFYTDPASTPVFYELPSSPLVYPSGSFASSQDPGAYPAFIPSIDFTTPPQEYGQNVVYFVDPVLADIDPYLRPPPGYVTGHA